MVHGTQTNDVVGGWSVAILVQATILLKTSCKLVWHTVPRQHIFLSVPHARMQAQQKTNQHSGIVSVTPWHQTAMKHHVSKPPRAVDMLTPQRAGSTYPSITGMIPGARFSPSERRGRPLLPRGGVGQAAQP